MDNCFIGRQPIFDRELNLFAYELLFRSSADNAANFANPDEATSGVILNAFVDIGLENLVNRHMAFINFTHRFLTDEALFQFPPGQVVIEILEDIEINDEIVEAVRKLKSRGYQLALDDFLFQEDYAALVELADYVKLDVMNMQEDEIRSHVEQLRQFDVRLLAEKVETPEEFALYHLYGFDYFQGYFFAKPEVVETGTMPHNKLTVLQLLSRVSNPETETEDLQDIIVQDAALSLRIMRYVNSPLSGLNRNIDSIHEAIVFLGRKMLRSMVMLITMSGFEDSNPELIVTGLVRARICELLIDAYGKEDKPETGFTVGLFSVLDAMLKASMDDVMNNMDVDESIRLALLERVGVYGGFLDCAEHLERGEVNDCRMRLNGDGEKDEAFEQLTGIYTNALQWADHMNSAVNPSGPLSP